MKVILFCDGYGMRMFEWSGEGLPRLLQLIDDLPLAVHVMSHYAAYGYTDFILCPGHTADQTQDAMNLTVTNHPRTHHWNVEYLDTGMDTPVGEQLWLARHLIAGEKVFFANYSDVLSDVFLDDMIGEMKASPDVAAMMLAVHPNVLLYMLNIREGEAAAGFHCPTKLPIREDGGYLILCQPFFDLLDGGHNLSVAFEILLASRQLAAYRHDGFWLPVDTFKEHALLDAMYDSGSVPWDRRDMVVMSQSPNRYIT